jgi:surface polysaccharide O-acyltransferase-like enzyme
MSSVKSYIPAKSKRIYEVDFLRAIAFFTVVLQHVIGAYGSRPSIQLSESVFLGLVFVLSKFAVPMFVFLSGMSLFYTYSQGLKISEFFSKRIKSILLPYIAWTLFYSYFARFGLPHKGDFALVAYRFTDHGFMAEVLRNLTFGMSYYHMWFVVMIFQFYLLFPLLLRVSRWIIGFSSPRLNSRVLIGVNLLWLGLLVVKTYVLPFVSLPVQNNQVFQFLMAWSDREFIYYFGYFTLGAQAGLGVDRWRAWIKNLSPSLWLGLGICYLIVCWEMLAHISNSHLDFMVAFTLKPEVALLCFGELLLLYRLSLKIPVFSLQAKLLKITSRYSFGAYFIHALMLQIVCLEVVDKLPFHDHIVATVLSVILGSTLSVALDWIWVKAYNFVLETPRSLQRAFQVKA